MTPQRQTNKVWSPPNPLFDCAAPGNDKGTQYRSAIFYNSAEQQELAQASLEARERKLRAKVANGKEKPWKQVTDDNECLGVRV